MKTAAFFVLCPFANGMHRFLQIITLTLVIFSPAIALAETSSPTPTFRHFTTEDGLPSSEVYFSLQDNTLGCYRECSGERSPLGATPGPEHCG